MIGCTDNLKIDHPNVTTSRRGHHCDSNSTYAYACMHMHKSKARKQNLALKLGSKLAHVRCTFAVHACPNVYSGLHRKQQFEL